MGSGGRGRNFPAPPSTPDYLKIEFFDLRNGFPTFLVRNPFLRPKIFFGCRNCEIVLIPTYYSAPSILL
jgi:hypothetical protein